MEAVVDMTPRLRIPSSSKREQRSLSPFSPPPFFSLSLLKCVTLFLPLPTLSIAAAGGFASSLFHPSLRPPSLTQKRRTLTEMTFDLFFFFFWNLRPPIHAPGNNAHLYTRVLFSFLTPPCLRRATHGCTGRRSTPPQRDGALPRTPGGRVARHKLARRPWSRAGWRSFSGPARTLDLRRETAGSKRKASRPSCYVIWVFDAVACWRLFTKVNQPSL